MRLDEDDYNQQDVATVLGDSSANMLGFSKISDGKSRDRLQRDGGTVKLAEDNSSKNEFETSVNAKSHDKFKEEF